MPSPPTDRRRAAHLLRAAVLGCLLATLSTGNRADEVRILVQSSPLAGSQYYAIEEAAALMRVGDPLNLVREPDNAHDPNAVRVEWNGRKLGYVPRRENRALAAALDAGERVAARVKKLRTHRNPWRRMEFEVFVSL